MPKTSKPNRTKKPRPAKRASKPKPTPRSRTINRAHLQQVCSNTDPFCPAAIGGKFLDAASTRSLAVPMHTRFTTGTDAAGYTSVMFTPSYLYVPYFTPFSITTGSVVFTTTAASSSPITATAVRLVSMGIKIRSVVAPLSASGIVRIRGFSPKLGTTLTTVNMSTYNCDYSEDVPLNSCKEACIILRRTDPTCKNFRAPTEINPSNLLTDMVFPGYGALMVSVEGGPASTTGVLDFEIFQNWEIILADDNTLAQVQTPAPVYNSSISTATDVISSSGKNVFLAGAAAVSAYVEKAAMNLLSELPSIVSLII